MSRFTTYYMCPSLAAEEHFLEMNRFCYCRKVAWPHLIVHLPQPTIRYSALSLLKQFKNKTPPAVICVLKQRECGKAETDFAQDYKVGYMLRRDGGTNMT